MNVYVINLKRRPDRLAHITAECKKHGIEFTRIEAVDGKEVFPGVRKKNMQGHLGCYKSHLNALKEIQKSGTHGLVLEDDCEFVDNMQILFDKCVAELPDDWDLFFLGGSLVLDNAITAHSENLRRAKSVLCTHAYFVNIKAVPGLIEHLEKRAYKIDVLYAEYQAAHNCYIAYPYIATQIEGHSDIVEATTDNKHLRYSDALNFRNLYD